MHLPGGRDVLGGQTGLRRQPCSQQRAVMTAVCVTSESEACQDFSETHIYLITLLPYRMSQKLTPSYM